ncbi:MAG: MmgE/PrpD family protein [Sphingomonadaceae bacterium]|uniref:MmgE/PrpD family protein n=1 Tax=Thermaurantiacus sp. TaxID=2820283 RepID=UPI00298F294A|nr:MmgE/PrpD family protein [Thermaurantiacus sp.]MCS6987192.1 MmgE/PrpD family protein [Sphingomonadaceae bacterium]MDW8415774.1 MmgE/PrpD family protein [Thermaurantiacus sp.]
MSGQTASLVERIAARATRPAPPTVVARARLHLLDWLACLAGARGEALATVARAAEPLSPMRAALLGSALEMDDVDRAGRVHPGPVVWPAVLLALPADAPMSRLIDAGVAGYEATVAVARMLDDHHYARCHPTHTAGRFGAAAAAARAAGADAWHTAQAMAIAGSSAGAYWQVRLEPASSKAFHAADAVAGGVRAARLALSGMTGPRQVLEGPEGLFAALCRAPAPLPEPTGFLIEGVSLKPWPACRHAHPAIDAALALPPDALRDGPIRVATFADALRFCDRPHPTTPGEARFSLQHALAVVTVRGRPRPADFLADALADPRLQTARARVEVAVDPELEAAYPAHFGARIEAQGQRALVRDAWGDPENPMDEPAVVAKLRTLARHGGLGEADADEARALALDTPTDAPAAPLIRLVERWLG